MPLEKVGRQNVSPNGHFVAKVSDIAGVLVRKSLKTKDAEVWHRLCFVDRCDLQYPKG